MNVYDLLPFYALDAVTDEERRFVEQQLAQNELLQAELAQLQAGVDTLAYQVMPMTPSASVKTQLLERVEHSQEIKPIPLRPVQASRSRWQNWLDQWRRQWVMPAFVMTAALALLLCIWSFSLLGRLRSIEMQLADATQTIVRMQDDLDESSAEITALETTITTLNMDIERLTIANVALQQQLEERTTTLAFYRDPALEHFEVTGTDLQTTAVGLFSVDASVMQAALWVTGLEALDPNQTYQLWYIGEDGVVSGGVFVVEADGRASILIDSVEIDPYNAIGISIEPSGGSETPSDQIVMLGSL
ncbi:MAG: anti-sigma factor domain-containing protein [Candidatus Promineifilaceae bacterium]